MDTKLTASVATFRVFSTSQRPASSGLPANAPGTLPPTRKDRMAATPVTEGPLILSRLASNEINYLQVNNFTRAIMPRSKIWRVSSNELVIPASFTNYWLITLSGSAQTISKLDHILKALCKYEVSCDEEEIEMTEEALADVEKVTSEIRMQSERVRDAQQTIRKGGFPGILNGGLGTIISNDETSTANQRRQQTTQESAQSVYLSPDSVGSAKTSTGPAGKSPRRSSVASSERAFELAEVEAVLATPPMSPPPSQITIESQITLESPASCASVPSHGRGLSQQELDAPSGTPKSTGYNLLDESDSVPREPASPAAETSLSDDSRDFMPRTPQSGRANAAPHGVPHGVPHGLPHGRALFSAPASPTNSREEWPLADETLEAQPLAQQPREASLDRRLAAGAYTTDDGRGAEPKLEAADVALMVSSLPPSPRTSASARSSLQGRRPLSVASAAAELVPFRHGQAKFEPRFSHPLIPSSHVSQYYPVHSTNLPSRKVALHRRELTTVGPSSLHQEVTTVGGYIGLRAVRGFFRKT